ncbi:guanyl-specific ribonuclease pgl-1-like [Folsomia candida]|uniref:guanyl-specific ribonuclease pgl-1-like n=1 Tax=Folsomia candida TaxID=158441 RepID=UPI000B8F73A3|nr:guanyl-specific ribonuclease pgl-1-like [Folsomia candida]
MKVDLLNSLSLILVLLVGCPLQQKMVGAIETTTEDGLSDATDDSSAAPPPCTTPSHPGSSTSAPCEAGSGDDFDLSQSTPPPDFSEPTNTTMPPDYITDGAGSKDNATSPDGQDRKERRRRFWWAWMKKHGGMNGTGWGGKHWGGKNRTGWGGKKRGGKFGKSKHGKGGKRGGNKKGKGGGGGGGMKHKSDKDGGDKKKD